MPAFDVGLNSSNSGLTNDRQFNDSYHPQSHYDRAAAELSRRRQLDLVIPSDISQLTERHQRQAASEAARLIDCRTTHKITWTDVYIALSHHCLLVDINKKQIGLLVHNGKIMKIKFVHSN